MNNYLDDMNQLLSIRMREILGNETYSDIQKINLIGDLVREDYRYIRDVEANKLKNKSFLKRLFGG